MAQNPLSNLVVVVTGGGRGIGDAIARACAGRGARVVAGVRSASGYPASAAPGRVASAPLDVTSESSVTALFAWLDRALGRVDVLVNNAGVSVFKPIDELLFAEWQRVIDTNLTGSFLCAREAVRRMKRTGGGRVVTIGSVADRVPLADCGAYGASKYGARGLTEVITEEGKAFRVFGTLVSLGAVATDAWSGRPGFDPGDMLSADDVAACVADLVAQPLHVRIDEIRIGPPKGVL